MQGPKGLWKRFLGFLEGGTEEEDWEYEQDMVDYGYPEEMEYDEGLDLSGGIADMERRDRGRRKTSNVLEFEASPDIPNLITVRIVRPKELQDATLICDHLKSNIICIVDMQGVEHPSAQRIADYLGGVSYALRGQIERIDNYIFVMAPEGAKIDSDLREELKTGGLFKSFR